jgi:hypothetical protein
VHNRDVGDHVGHAGLVATALLFAAGCSLIDAAGTDSEEPAAGPDGAPDSGGDCSMFDDFEDGVTGEAWDDFSQPGASVSEEAGGVRVSFSGAGAFAGYYLRGTVDLTEGEVLAQIADVGGTYTILQVERDSALVSLYVEAGQVIIATVEGAGDSDIGVPAEYVPAEDVFWRIRGEGGFINWELSDDQNSWVTLHRAEAPFALDQVEVSIAAGGVDGDPPALFESFAMSATGCTQ